MTEFQLCLLKDFAVLKEAIESKEGKKLGCTGNKNREILSNAQDLLKRGSCHFSQIHWSTLFNWTTPQTRIYFGD